MSYLIYKRSKISFDVTIYWFIKQKFQTFATHRWSKRSFLKLGRLPLRVFSAFLHFTVEEWDF